MSTKIDPAALAAVLAKLPAEAKAQIVAELSGKKLSTEEELAAAKAENAKLRKAAGLAVTKASNVGEVLGFRTVERKPGQVKVQIVIVGGDGKEAKFSPEVYPGTLRSLAKKAAEAVAFLDAKGL